MYQTPNIISQAILMGDRYFLCAPYEIAGKTAVTEQP
jgi:hypothetical protein